MLSSAVALAETVVFDRRDIERLQDLCHQAATVRADAEPLLAAALGGSYSVLRRRLRYAHMGILLFPSSIPAARRYFDKAGFAPSNPTPSVLVRRRLAARYQVAIPRDDIAIVHLSYRGTEVEVFLLRRGLAQSVPGLMAAERHAEYERHTAFAVHPQAAEDAVRAASAAFLFEEGARVLDRDATTFYFVHPDVATVVAGWRRLELQVAGDHGTLLRGQTIDAARVSAAYAELGRLGVGDGG